MTGATRRVYIVSDLHLGGAQAAAGERGFQICTQTAALAELIDRLAARNPDNGGEELVIAGDFVDFWRNQMELAKNGDPVWKRCAKTMPWQNSCCTPWRCAVRMSLRRCVAFPPPVIR